MTTTKIFGNKIKDLRNKFDFTQSDIEHFSGVNVNIIRQIETGRSGTSKENMLAIANALKVPIEEIYINDYKNTVVLTVINSKGDCGKTSIVQNLSYELSLLKDKCVLIIDSDLQCSLTKSFSMN